MVVLIGSEAGISNTGDNAIAIGSESGRVNTAAATVSIGHNSGYSNTSGAESTNIGYQAGYSNTTGGENVNVGYTAGKFQTQGGNVFVGRRSGLGVSGSSTGYNNTGIGQSALWTVTSGNGNTGVGQSAGAGISTGYNNTAIGNNALASANTNIGCVVIGNGANASTTTVVNEVTISSQSGAARFAGAATAWTFVSDKRDKKDIEDLELGLDFINKLKPRKFKWDIRGTEIDKNKEASGFIAQEVQETLEEAGADYTGIVDKNNLEQFTLAQANIVPMLVKAIQELKAEIELLKQ